MLNQSKSLFLKLTSCKQRRVRTWLSCPRADAVVDELAELPGILDLRTA
jgi:hypothetical protein